MSLIAVNTAGSQVQQRGVIGTKEILLKLIDGLDIPPDSRVFVTDLTPNK